MVSYTSLGPGALQLLLAVECLAPSKPPKVDKQSVDCCMSRVFFNTQFGALQSFVVWIALMSVTAAMYPRNLTLEV